MFKKYEKIPMHDHVVVVGETFYCFYIFFSLSERQLNGRKLFVNLLWCIAYCKFSMNNCVCMKRRWKYNIWWLFCITFVCCEEIYINEIALRGVTLWKLVAILMCFCVSFVIAVGWLIAFYRLWILYFSSRLKLTWECFSLFFV